MESNPYIITQGRHNDQGDFENGFKQSEPHNTVSAKERAYNPNAYTGFNEKHDPR